METVTALLWSWWSECINFWTPWHQIADTNLSFPHSLLRKTCGLNSLWESEGLASNLCALDYVGFRQSSLLIGSWYFQDVIQLIQNGNMYCSNILALWRDFCVNFGSPDTLGQHFPNPYSSGSGIALHISQMFLVSYAPRPQVPLFDMLWCPCCYLWSRVIRSRALTAQLHCLCALDKTTSFTYAGACSSYTCDLLPIPVSSAL